MNDSLVKALLDELPEDLVADHEVLEEHDSLDWHYGLNNEISIFINGGTYKYSMYGSILGAWQSFVFDYTDDSAIKHVISCIRAARRAQELESFVSDLNTEHWARIDGTDYILEGKYKWTNTR